MDYDFSAMRRDGYSDDQILTALNKAGQLPFDLEAVRKDGYSASAILQSMAGGQRAAPPAPEPASSSLLRRAGDVGISALKGVIGVPEALVGLADIPTGGAAGRAAESLGVKFKESKELLSDLYSPEQKAANQRVAEAEGFTGTAGAMLANPSTIAQTAIESIPAMGLGGAVGRGVLAVAPKLGALGAAAVGEGAVGAGTAAEQIRQQSGGDLSLGQSGAALASGIGTGVFGLVGGRLAQKLGIGDIDTMLVRAGAPQQSGKGVARRMLEGGVSEGVFEELPQSMQEQIWQNAAMDRPLMDGVPESAAQGLLVGGLFGGVAGGALGGRSTPAADTPPAVDPATGAPLQLGYDPEVTRRNNNPFIVFPDGSVGRQEDVDDFISRQPEADRNAFRARLMGYAPQDAAPTVTTDDVLATVGNADATVDDAIATAQQALASDTPEMKATRDAQIDAAWKSYIGERAAQRQAEIDAAEQQRRDADVPAMQAQLADQQVEQAEAITRAQGFDEPAPTAMQLAMQEAQAKRQAAVDAATAPAVEVATAAPEAAAVPDQAAELAQAKQILSAAGVTGNERMAALRAIRTRENTLDDLIDAHPPKGASNDVDTPAARVLVPDVAPRGDEAVAVQRPAAAPGLPAAAEPVAAQPASSPAPAVAGPADLPDADGAAGPRAPAPLNERAEPSDGGFTNSLSRTASWVIRNKATGEVMAETFDSKKVDALNKEKYEAVPVNQHLAEINDAESKAGRVARGEKRQATIDDLASRTTKELRALAKTDKRAYVRNAVAEIIAERDSATRAKRSDAAKRALVKAKKIDPDQDTMADAIARMGGIRRDSAQGRMRFAPEEVTARAGIRPLFPVNGGMRIEDMGAALAELGYVQRDENGKYDQSDFEEKLAEVAGGAEVRTPQGMMLRAQQDFEAAQQQAFSESPAEYEQIEYYADNADDEIQRMVDAAFDAPHKYEEFTDEEIDAKFGIAPAAGRAVPEVDTEAPAREGNRGDQAPAGEEFGLTSETPDQVRARVTDQEESTRRAAAEQRAQDDAARRDRERRDIAARQDASADNFQLGQSADDSLSGQQAMFSRAAQVSSAAFKKWFGDSKVVNADGSPQIVYHGTTQGDIEQFQAGWASVTEAGGKAFYFSDWDANASSYAERGKVPKNGGRAVYPVYLSLQDPLVIDLGQTGSTWAQIDFNSKNPMPQRLKEAIAKANYIIPEQMHTLESWYTVSLAELANYAEQAGYDGVIARNLTDGGSKKTMKRQTTFVAFKPTQIKSAIGNSGNFDPANGDLRASTGTAPAGGMTAADVTRAIAPLRAKWASFTRINVVQSPADLPAEITGRIDVDQFSEGFYDPRTDAVYLIADNIESPDRAAWVAAHEVVGHGGLRMLNDKTVTQAVQQAGANRFIRDLAQAIRLDRGMGTPEHIALEEAIAELSAATETGDFDALADRYGVTVPDSARGGIRGVVARVVAAVRQFLATVTRQPVESFTDSDVRDLIAQQRAAVEGNQFTDVSKMVDDGVRASDRRRSIEVNGVRRSIENSRGQVIVQDFNKQMAFYRWFGDSAVVDDKGRPRVVFHGTNADFDRFDDGKVGSSWDSGKLGKGFYFSTDSRLASSYATNARAKTREDAPQVMPVYLSIENPLEIGPLDWQAGENLWDKLRDFSEQAGIGIDPVSDPDSNQPNPAWSEPFRNALKRFGYDGVMLKFADGHQELVAFDPAQIKSATGNAGTFNPDDADIRASRAPSGSQAPAGEERIPAWAEPLTAEQKDALRKSGAIYTEKTMKQKVKELTDGALKKMQYGIMDQFAPIKDQLGRMPYIMARMAKAADGTLEAMMLYGRPHLDADGGMLVDTTKKGFIETMQQLDGEHDRFFSWLAGKRAAQLKKEGRENLFTDTDISALATLNQGTMKDGSSREAAYLRAQKDVAELNKSVLDIAEKSGLIDAESRKVWQSDFYVPFYRIIDDATAGPSIKSGLVNQKSIKKLKGGTNNLGDLTQNMLMNWSTLLTASAKNRAAKASLDVAAGMGVASEAPESTLKAMAKSAQTRAVSYMEDGQNRWFIVEDEHLLAAISALEFNGYNNNAMRAMSWFKNTLTKAITVSPYFKVRNLIRDSLSVLAVSDIKRNPFANVWNGGKSLIQDKDMRAQMVAGGGMYRFGMTMEGNRGENIKRLIDDGIADETILNTAEKMARFTRKLWRSYEEVGDLTENANRASLYKQLRAEGKSHLEASFEARDLMDFGLSGAWAGVRALNQILPFFNARLQGLYKLGRGYNDDPKRMGYVIGALALASMALSMAYKDDDDWKKRSDSDRNNYWWFKVGGIAYRIPKPFEIGAAATAIDHFAALFYDSENTNTERFTHQMGELINGQLAMNPIPQVFRPLIDVYSNKDAFSGRPIESMAMQRLRPEDRYSHNTSELARLLSKSGALVDPVSLVAGTGVKQLSPVQIDSLIKGYFAGVGVLAVSAADGLLHHTLIDRGAALPASLRSMTGSFVEELPTNSSRYVDMLYKTAQDVEQTYASYQNAIKQGDIEKARQIQRDEGATLAKYHMIESLKKNESRIGQVIQRTINDKSMTGEQKAEAIRRLKVVQDRIARQMVTGK